MGEKGLFPGEDLFFKVAAEVVEEAELVVGAHQAVDDVRKVPALRDMKQNHEVTHAMNHLHAALRDDFVRDEKRTDEADELHPVACKTEREIRDGLLRAEHFQHQIYRFQLFANVVLQGFAQGIVLHGEAPPALLHVKIGTAGMAVLLVQENVVADVL